MDTPYRLECFFLHFPSLMNSYWWWDPECGKTVIYKLWCNEPTIYKSQIKPKNTCNHAYWLCAIGYYCHRIQQRSTGMYWTQLWGCSKLTSPTSCTDKMNIFFPNGVTSYPATYFLSSGSKTLNFQTTSSKFSNRYIHLQPSFLLDSAAVGYFLKKYKCQMVGPFSDLCNLGCPV